jgi:hypothetical protein
VFTSAGHFPYECSFHYFQGSVNVATTGNIPPSVTITNPADGSVFSAPADVTLSATTSDGSGNVTNVQFFQGTTSLTNLAGGPFTIVVSGLAAGTYAFSAVATDTLGDTNSSAISISVVTPVAISLSNLQRLPGGQFQFDYTADVGLSYVVERSTSLPGFTPLSTKAFTESDVCRIHDINALAIGRVPARYAKTRSDIRLVNGTGHSGLADDRLLWPDKRAGGEHNQSPERPTWF